MTPTSPEDGFRRAYTTDLGTAFQGDSRDLLMSPEVPSGSVDLLMMSPPFALTRKKDYGNEAEDRFVEWFTSFVVPFRRALSETGSLVIDIGGAYIPGRPRRSTYHFELAVALSRHFELCQEFYWYNPAKLPSPAEWVTVRRQRVKDAVNLVLWFAKDANRAKADNRRVLKRYSASMESLLKSGYQYRTRPSGHDITEKFTKRHPGAIPPNLLGVAESPDGDGFMGEPFEENFPNLLALSNTSSNDRYQKACKERGIKPHPARFPIGLPGFFIEFLTEPGDIVLDPFAGSNVTGEAAETLGRRWISCDLDREGKRSDTYVRASALRFDSPKFEAEFDYEPFGNYDRPAQLATGEAA
jgi:DNA modification methylase